MDQIEAVLAGGRRLRGNIRNHATSQRRMMVRCFAYERDLSDEPPDAPLPYPVESGGAHFWALGAIAGG